MVELMSGSRLRHAWLIALLMLISIVFQTSCFLVIDAIPVRQDPNMNVGGELTVGINNITKLLSRLSSQLNDTLLKKYREELISNASAGNYASINEIINKLRTYLRLNYMNKSLTGDEASEVSLISSINGVSPGTATINMSEALRTYAELMNNDEVLKALRMLTREGSNHLTVDETEALLNALTKILTVIRGGGTPTKLPKPPTKESPSGRINLTLLNRIPRLPTSMPKPHISLTQENNLGFIASVMLILVIISIALYISLRTKPGMAYLLRKYVAVRLAKPSRRASSINDPIVRAYFLTLKHLEVLGIRKLPYETPREFSRRVRNGEYAELLRKLTPAYEVKAYGNGELREVVTEELLQLVRKVIGTVRL